VPAPPRLYEGREAYARLCPAILNAMEAQNMETSVTPGRAAENETWFLAKLNDCIKQNCGNPNFGVPQLAALLGLNRTRLTRKLADLTGCSPGKMIMRQRLRRAEHLLQQESLPVKDIAWQSGFHGHGSFCRSFYQEHKCSPSQFRNACSNIDSGEPFCWKIPLHEKDMMRLVDIARQKPWLNGLLKIVIPNLGNETFTVEQLAGSLYISCSSLHRKMKETFSVSPQRFITDLRLQYASELLARKEGSVTEVAYKAGFFDQAHLCRSFKNVFGCRPSSYQGENGNGEAISITWLKKNLAAQNAQ
jgi:AraC-like DNA-binding protein